MGAKNSAKSRGAEGSCFATTPLKSVDTSARITVTKALETATTTVAGSGNVADHQKVQLQKQVESKKMRFHILRYKLDPSTYTHTLSRSSISNACEFCIEVDQTHTHTHALRTLTLTVVCQV